MAKQTSREIESKGHKGEIVGSSSKCQLWIGGKLYGFGITTLQEARRQFMSYASRHPK